MGGSKILLFLYLLLRISKIICTFAPDLKNTLIMKHTKIILLAFAVIAFIACEKPQTHPVVHIKHEVKNVTQNDSCIEFVAYTEADPAIMFYWWIRKNGVDIMKGEASSLAIYNGEWQQFKTDTASVMISGNGLYTATLRYYDSEYNTYYAKDSVYIP